MVFPGTKPSELGSQHSRDVAVGIGRASDVKKCHVPLLYIRTYIWQIVKMLFPRLSGKWSFTMGPVLNSSQRVHMTEVFKTRRSSSLLILVR
jgi:hypothetical protein